MSYQSAVLAGAPDLYVPFTEGSGTSFADVSGHGHTVTLDPSVAAGAIAAGGLASPLAGEGALQVGDGLAGAIRLALALPGTIPCHGAFTVQYWVQYPATGGYPGGNAPLTIGEATLHAPPVDQNPYATFVNALQTVVNVQPGWLQHNVQVAGYVPTPGVLAGSPLDSVFPLCWHRWSVTWDGATLALYRDTDVLTVHLSYGALAALNTAFTPSDASFFAFGPPSGGVLLPAAIFGLAHLVIYGRALSAAELAATYGAAVPRGDADCFGAPHPVRPWVQLRHATNLGRFRTRGDLSQVWAAGTLREEWPYATLAQPAAVLVGQDPTSLLPAYCPAPVNLSDPSIKPTPPGTTLTTCVQVRCGVAAACTDHLISLYDHWANPINAAIATLGTALVVAFVVLSLDPIMALIDFAVWQFIRPLLEAVAADVFLQGCGTITPDMRAELRHRCFCALTCAGDVCTPDAAAMVAWSNNLTAAGWVGFDRLEAIVLNGLIVKTPLSAWLAAASVAVPSHDCDLLTCP